MFLLTGIPVGIDSGTYNVKMDMSSGDALIQWQIQPAAAFQDVPESVQTSSTGFTLDLPNCKVQSLITGDATVELNVVKGN